MISWVCGFLFALFSLLYLFMAQGDLLATAQHLLSKGQTAYSPAWGAVVITFLLLLLQGAWRRIIVYPLRFHALYYFPSCVVLGVLTSIVPKTGWDVQLSTNWTWLAVCVFLDVLVTWAALHFPDRKNGKQNVFPLLWTNFLWLALLFCMVNSLANTNDVYHYRLKAERYLMKGEDSLALQVGAKSLQADRSLTAIRAFALSREELLGERLFEYPQLDGSQGLLPSLSDTTCAHNWTNALYRHLGGKPGRHIRGNTRFLELLSQRPSATAAAKDYLLCAYLLDKNLDAFAAALPRYHEADDKLPTHYKEALILYNHLHAIRAFTYKNSAMEANLDDFLHYGMQYANATERSNQCRRLYGNTYWWYYYYQTLPPEQATFHKSRPE